jgi:hypothetical protein
MKANLTLVLSITLICTLLVARFSYGEAQLHTVDISFTALKTDHRHGFAFLTFVDIKPNTRIFFSDSEWNGTRFGIGESTLIWTNGKTVLPAGSVVTFEQINSKPKISHGSVGQDEIISEIRGGLCLFGYSPKITGTFLSCGSQFPRRIWHLN